jgi:hypothetical protein
VANPVYRSQPGNTSPWECPECMTSPGRPCTYLSTVAYIDTIPRRRVVVHQAGDPMARMHYGRPRVRSVPLWTVLPARTYTQVDP